ncbi:MAG: 4a-hydroxytetrahydrobiopterin dehydratase [Brasilonema octagenarum HA4186-MV1]|jgi:pterin-4a-carbinolamine dehydratase|uniref:4a-hydroxytetrahydrobiopterin dehydratase n=2 Tax=Brasilonema TaxID=383614 RepID=A0A856MNM2_9CYAN|nr:MULTISPECIES: 4a-hydroxytetrahydrobiopterin dehydratase [Brasilonema]MBW4629249.1 4a-hydroxytetrahydrobiopterin dehydratase [Brasilonema octagenarum HA4186-MV1]NMF64592.1 pterin dehydratase [Brasilonema octagenarum UFV-OR1]QDL11714.1 pterin dehydratase [Brasilonema sennae CENA114]QDL18094.1 pterin dehydratase [Brasilonema octagenarum UFV-E1]
MFKPPIFISYRRSDITSEAGRLYSTISKEIGKDMVFIDTSSIEPGTDWPQELVDALEASLIAVLVIGPDWIKSSDEYGLRRIDQEDDWVRKEIEYCLAKGKKILPVLFNGAKMPPSNKLPSSIAPITSKQAVEIRNTYWDHDIKLVLTQLRASIDNIHHTSSEVPWSDYPIPHPEKPEEISDEKLSIALANHLSQWEKVISPLPENQSNVRIELFRKYKFKTFLDAVEFMNKVAPGCEIVLHHPRWENIWKTLRVYLTTWDIGHRISDRDIQLAKYFDKAYAEFPGAVGDSSKD